MDFNLDAPVLYLELNLVKRIYQNILIISKSVFATLENLYDDIFLIQYREIEGQDLDHKNGREVKVRISFHDNDCYLYCKEIFDRDSMLVDYYYDWYAENGQIL